MVELHIDGKNNSLVIIAANEDEALDMAAAKCPRCPFYLVDCKAMSLVTKKANTEQGITPSTVLSQAACKPVDKTKSISWF